MLWEKAMISIQTTFYVYVFFVENVNLILTRKSKYVWAQMATYMCRQISSFVFFPPIKIIEIISLLSYDGFLEV